MSGTFEKDSLGWQAQLLQMRVGEWLEQLFAPPNPDVQIPEWFIPEWFWRSAFWVIATALVVWVGWQLYLLLRPYLSPYWLRRHNQAMDRAGQADVETLTVSEWLQRSRSFAQQGNYREACRALYLATVQKLDERELIPNQLSRTDGEYLNILQTFANPRPYQVLFRTHERLCFSNTEIAEDLYEDCEQAYREIETA